MGLEPVRAAPPLELPPVPADDRAAALARLPPLPPRRPPGWQVAFYGEGQRVVREAQRAGASGRTVVRLQSGLVDRLIEGLAADLGLPERGVALVAQGGYGRRELSPASDVDLLILSDAPLSIDGLLYPLWDLKLEVGHALRPVQECLGLAAEDPVTLTTLLDARLLAGDPGRFAELGRGVEDLLRRQGEAFIQAKRAELVARRLRFGQSVYLLEPNVKQCEGGLRDLQTAVWIARARYRLRGLRQLLASSILPPSSVAEAMRARDFLWRIRNELHLLTGRKEDHLTFDHQEKVAALLGYGDRPEGLAVEQFMRHYYLAAAAVKRIADEIIDRCAEGRPARRRAEEPVDAEFKIWDGRLTVTGSTLFADDPTAIARAFLVSAQLGAPLYSYARDLVVAALPRVDDAVRADPRATSALAALIGLPGTDGEWLAPMHELGVLDAFLPELAGVRALAQHDLYHVYTVDVHLLFALRRLYALRRGDLVQAQPALTRLCLQVSAWLPLCLGVLFHDAGKGRGGQHSQRGAELVGRVARRLGLSPRDVETAEFLVREHLTLSHVAQRRDLSDPEMIRAFAATMGDPERLDLLYLLTYVDVSSVGPSTWTDWKGRLFHELHEKARAVLAPEAAAAPPEGRRLLRALERLGVSAGDAERFLARMPDRYLHSVRPREALRHLRILGRLKREAPLASRRVPAASVTELILCAADRPGLLALFAGALAAHRIDILSAEVYSTATGEAIDIFHVQAAGGGAVDAKRWADAREDLRRVLSGVESAQALLARRLRPSKLPSRALPAVPTRVRLDNQSATNATVLDVTTEDRLGLLFTLARTLHGLGLEIALAKVSTEANRAVDAFYVTLGGRKIEDPAECLRLERAVAAALA
ncbi:MAG TPA: [protein-PII] uridylyltransferase [Myxococcales bacterium]|nr:[protein-PII] uridylyltransferase [Myxococcales bacterium]